MGENYLIHHGILGQKWGHMQGPPYPLGSGDHSSAEKSAAKSAGVKVGKASDGKSYGVNYKRHTNAANKIQKDADDLRKHGMTKEADAVQKVADKHKAKADKIAAKKDEKRYNATENGSVKTNTKAEKIGEIDKKYANSSNRKWKKEVDKAFKDYEKSANKDEKTALKNGDIDAARSINAGRTYMRTIIDGNYRVAAIALANNVAAGKTYVTDITRDNKLGGVDMVYADGTIFNISDSKR